MNVNKDTVEITRQEWVPRTKGGYVIIDYDKDGHFKSILISFGCKIDGVPQLVLPDEMDSLLYEEDYDIYYPKSICEFASEKWKQGYNAHKATHPYSREDVKRAMEMAIDIWCVKGKFGNYR